jgi:bifunctional lysine-specific demethylase and histidyl-hydroxylase NO66
VDAPALGRLVGDPADFLGASWGRAPLHVAAGDGRAGPLELLTLDDVDQLVATSGLRAPAFRLIKQGVTLPQSSVTRRVRIGSRPVSDLVDVVAVHRAISEGATLVLQGLHRSFAPVASFCRDLEATLTHPVQANAYLTPPVAQGLNLHEDPHDVFAVQTYGAKRWVVHPPGESEDRAWDLLLQPGDVLYLPAGTRHAAQTVDTPSLHLTLGVRTVTWRDVVGRAVDEVLAGRADLDEPLPAGWASSPESLGPALADRLSGVAAGLRERPDHDAVLERQASSFWSSRTPDLTGGLRDLLELDAVADDTVLRRRDGVTARMGIVGDRLEVVLRDRILRMPATVASAVERAIEAPTVRPVDLDEFLDGPSRSVLCRRLVREGLLTVDRTDRGTARG